jgi:hypothetical protein
MGFAEVRIKGTKAIGVEFPKGPVRHGIHLQKKGAG